MAAYVRCFLLCEIQGSGWRDGRDVTGEWGEAGCGHYRRPLFFARSRCHAVLLPLKNP